MKKLICFLLALSLALFMACGDDDSNISDKKDYGKILVGTWLFTHGYSSAGGPYAAGWCPVNGDVILKLNSDGSCSSMGSGSYNNGITDISVRVKEYFKWCGGNTSAYADYWFELYFIYNGSETGDDYYINFLSEKEIEITRVSIGSIKYRLKKIN